MPRDPLPPYRGNDLQAVDDTTAVLRRDGARAHLPGVGLRVGDPAAHYAPGRDDASRVRLVYNPFAFDDDILVEVAAARRVLDV